MKLGVVVTEFHNSPEQTSSLRLELGGYGDEVNLRVEKGKIEYNQNMLYKIII